MSDIPDGANTVVAAMAIAWELTKEAMKHNVSDSADQSKDGQLRIYEEALKKIDGLL